MAHTGLLGILIAQILGSGVSVAVVRSGDKSASPSATITVETTVVTEEPTTSAPTTTVATARPTSRGAPPTTTRATVTATSPPATASQTTAAATTTTRPLTPAEATRALCTAIETSVRQVVSGNEVGGGLRLSAAIGTYGDVADQSVVAPARRMLSRALAGDLESSALAALDAQEACRRAGFPITYPRQPQCVTLPCPPF